MTNHVSAERRSTLILGPVQKAALAARLCEESESLLDHFKVTRSGLLQVYDAAITAGDGHTSASIARAMNETNALIGKLTGELANSPLVQHNNLTLVMQSGAAQEFFGSLAQVLGPFPDALRAVVQWLETKKATELPALPHDAIEAA